MCLSVSADGRSFDSTIKGVRHSSVFGALILLVIVAVAVCLALFVAYLLFTQALYNSLSSSDIKYDFNELLCYRSSCFFLGPT